MVHLVAESKLFWQLKWHIKTKTVSIFFKIENPAAVLIELMARLGPQHRPVFVEMESSQFL